MAVLNVDDAAHLLRRAGFGGTLAEINALAGQDRAAAVENLFSAPVPADVPPANFSDSSASDWDRWVALTQWWYERMISSTNPLVEKMTLFWHGHFCSAQDKVGNVLLMYQQNAMFRANALGNFRALAHAVGRDPAMLFYLDNDPNVKGVQNENFARELWELFTLGIGNYTQDDIVASAKAWTGHGVTPWPGPYSYQFTDSEHDHSQKTIFGQTHDWDGDDVLDLTLADQAQGISLAVDKRGVSARFIAKKLWTFFAYPNPDPSLVNLVADAFVANAWDVTSALRVIFNHDAFYSTTAKQGLVRSPAEFMAACMKYSGIGPADAHPEWYADQMGQELFNPPDVSGWKNNAYWISAAGFWARASFVRDLTWQASSKKILLDTRSMTVPAAVQAILDEFALTTVTPTTRTALQGWLTAERAAHGWAERVNLFTLVMLTPDFQLA